MSLSGDLCLGTVERIAERTKTTEVLTDGGAFLDLPSEMGGGAGGVCRVWEGGALERMVYVALAAPAVGLDSHMVFAFLPSDSLVPHFTLDSVIGHGSHAFHLDLIPRVDLGANLAYMDEVFEPLTDVFHGFADEEGWTPARLTPRQRGMMSNWMLANHGTAEAFAGVGTYVDAYLERWFEVIDRGVDAEVRTLDVAERDLRNRTALFSPEVDPVWDRIRPLIGTAAVDRVRGLLCGEAL